jgi:hypothetical protein
MNKGQRREGDKGTKRKMKGRKRTRDENTKDIIPVKFKRAFTHVCLLYTLH